MYPDISNALVHFIGEAKRLNQITERTEPILASNQQQDGNQKQEPEKLKLATSTPKIPISAMSGSQQKDSKKNGSKASTLNQSKAKKYIGITGVNSALN